MSALTAAGPRVDAQVSWVARSRGVGGTHPPTLGPAAVAELVDTGDRGAALHGPDRVSAPPLVPTSPTARPTATWSSSTRAPKSTDWSIYQTQPGSAARRRGRGSPAEGGVASGVHPDPLRNTNVGDTAGPRGFRRAGEGRRVPAAENARGGRNGTTCNAGGRRKLTTGAAGTARRLVADSRAAPERLAGFAPRPRRTSHPPRPPGTSSSAPSVATEAAALDEPFEHRQPGPPAAPPDAPQGAVLESAPGHAVAARRFRRRGGPAQIVAADARSRTTGRRPCVGPSSRKTRTTAWANIANSYTASNCAL